MDLNCGKITRVIRNVVRKQMYKGYYIQGYDEEDLVQEVFCHFVEAKLFEKYNPAITSLDYLIWISTYNYLQTISKRDKLRYVSLDRTIGETSDSDTFLDMVSDPHDFIKAMESEEFINSILLKLPNEDISPNYHLSLRELFQKLFMFNIKPKDVAKSLGITPGRVSQLESLLKKKIRAIILEMYPEYLSIVGVV